MLRIAILGSTGSIGSQALEVIGKHPDDFCVTALLAHSRAQELVEQVRVFSPRVAALVHPPQGFCPTVGCEWIFGEKAMTEICSMDDVDAVLVAVVGIAGLPAVLCAIAHGKKILLANKEALVTGGMLVMEAARRANVPVLPVDSEHSAIFQCLQGVSNAHPTSLVLTASGGPFRTWSTQEIRNATLEAALRHPNWSMGKKITIDSASMVNKALEVIEAHYLFSMPPECIEVLIHPQSIVHSAVRFADGAMLAQLGLPDMRVPIAYALRYPQRLTAVAPQLDLTQCGALTFQKPDDEKFPVLKLAYAALRAGGSAPTVLNAANEVAVQRVLARELPFYRIADLIAQTLACVPQSQIHTPDDVYVSDAQARRVAGEIALLWQE